jgi:hypothetical protein
VSETRALLRLLESYGVRLIPVGSDGFSWDAVEFRGEKLDRPVRVLLHSDEAVGAYIDGFGSGSAAARDDVLELAMMDIVEGLETTDLAGRPAFRAIGLRGGPGGEVVWFQERYPATTPPQPVCDVEWRADPS